MQDECCSDSWWHLSCANGLVLVSTRPIATLTTQQLGRFAEYFVTMALVRNGMDVYTPAVDDRGIDLIARIDVGTYLEVQVKATRGDSYVYVRKSVFPIHPNRYLAYVSFDSEADPDVFLIPQRPGRRPTGCLQATTMLGRRAHLSTASISHPRHDLFLTRTVWATSSTL